MIIVPLALTVALLTGCAPGYGSSSDSAAPSPAGGSEFFAGDSVSGGPAEQAPLGSDPATWGPADEKSMSVAGPQIITTVDLTVTVTTPPTAADDASKIANKFGGSVSYRTENAATDDYPGSAQLTLRIPSAKLTPALDELKELGVARGTSINAVDVTAESTDLDARITSLQTSVDRLLTLMSQASSTENLLAVESALSQRQADLESLQAQKRNLDDQVQLSTVNLYLPSEASTPAPAPSNFWTGLVTGWNAFVGFGAGALVVLGVLVPWLVAAGLITLIIIVWVKRTRPRRAAKRAARPTYAAPAYATPAPAAAPATAVAAPEAPASETTAQHAVGSDAVAPTKPASKKLAPKKPASKKPAPKKSGKA